MDGTRFDELIRSLTSVRTRRNVARTVAGGVAAGIAAQAALRDAEACSPLGGYCRNTSECCDPLRCIYAECAQCIATGDPCKDNKDCCSDMCDGGTCIRKKDCRKSGVLRRGCRNRHHHGGKDH